MQVTKTDKMKAASFMWQTCVTCAVVMERNVDDVLQYLLSTDLFQALTGLKQVSYDAMVRHQHNMQCVWTVALHRVCGLGSLCCLCG